MRKNKAEAALFARYISEFLYDYAPCFLTHSDHTIKAIPHRKVGAILPEVI